MSPKALSIRFRLRVSQELLEAGDQLERRSDAGEDQVGATNALVLQPLHPAGDTRREFAQDIGPVSNRRS